MVSQIRRRLAKNSLLFVMNVVTTDIMSCTIFQLSVVIYIICLVVSLFFSEDLAGVEV